MRRRPTDKQKKLFVGIQKYHEDHGYGPTSKNIALELGLSSSRVYQLLTGLEERGWIKWERYKSGSIAPADGVVNEASVTAPWASMRPSLLERAKASIHRAKDMDEFRYAVMVARLVGPKVEKLSPAATLLEFPDQSLLVSGSQQR